VVPDSNGVTDKKWLFSATPRLSDITVWTLALSLASYTKTEIKSNSHRFHVVPYSRSILIVCIARIYTFVPLSIYLPSKYTRPFCHCDTKNSRSLTVVSAAMFCCLRTALGRGHRQQQLHNRRHRMMSSLIVPPGSEATKSNNNNNNSSKKSGNVKGAVYNRVKTIRFWAY
jgi:hypothetical protein